MRKALVVGVNDYPFGALGGCINDANAIANILETHGDGSPNFDVRLMTSPSDVVKGHDPAKAAIFKHLQKFTSVGLVIPVDEEHMYYAAMNSKSCRLTALGYQYWRLVKEKRL